MTYNRDVGLPDFLTSSFSALQLKTRNILTDLKMQTFGSTHNVEHNISSTYFLLLNNNNNNNKGSLWQWVMSFNFMQTQGKCFQRVTAFRRTDVVSAAQDAQ